MDPQNKQKFLSMLDDFNKSENPKSELQSTLHKEIQNGRLMIKYTDQNNKIYI